MGEENENDCLDFCLLFLLSLFFCLSESLPSLIIIFNLHLNLRKSNVIFTKLHRPCMTHKSEPGMKMRNKFSMT